MRTRTRLVALMPAAVVALLVTGAALALSGLTYNGTARLSVSNTEATVTGTVTCDPVFDVNANLFAEILQGRGSQILIASGSATVTCTGSPQPWAVVVSTSQGQTLKTGSASVNISAYNATFSSSQTVSGPIHLKN